jgi:hypothetical protein
VVDVEGRSDSGVVSSPQLSNHKCSYWSFGRRAADGFLHILSWRVWGIFSRFRFGGDLMGKVSERDAGLGMSLRLFCSLVMLDA